MNYTFQGIGIGIGEIQLVLRDEMNNVLIKIVASVKRATSIVFSSYVPT